MDKSTSDRRSPTYAGSSHADNLEHSNTQETQQLHQEQSATTTSSSSHATRSSRQLQQQQISNTTANTSGTQKQPLVVVNLMDDDEGDDRLDETASSETIQYEAALGSSMSQPPQPQQQQQHQQQQDAPPSLATSFTGNSDLQEAALASVRRQRFPLTEPYHPYICASDTCLEDARRRLKTALEQTRMLRQAFTERVSSKYRVSLQPPPKSLNEIVEPIENNPEAALKRLQEEMEQERVERELEKRDLDMGTPTLSKRSTTFNVDHPDQLMYMSAGLNLVILPEGSHDMVLAGSSSSRGANPRGRPVNPPSSSQTQSGEVILDRTRKAIFMRHERLKKARADPALASSLPVGLRPAEMETTVAAATTKPSSKIAKDPPAAVSTPSGAAAAAKKSPATATVKKGREKSSFSAAALLSLHPHSDQLDAFATRPTASTTALVARSTSVGQTAPNSKASTQLRLRHPHPESLGGRRRAGNLAGPVLLKYTLPPLPADRTERKPLPVIPLQEAATQRAKNAIQTVLEPFQQQQQCDKSTTVTSIGMLHHIWKSSSTLMVESDTRDETGISEEPLPESDMDPMVAYLVMRSVGLLQEETNKAGNSATLPKSLSAAVSLTSPNKNEKLDLLSRAICADTPSITQSFEAEDSSRKRQFSSQGNQQDSAKRARPQIPVESIRGGGGGEPQNKKEDNKAMSAQEQRSVDTNTAPSTDHPQAPLPPAASHGTAQRGSIVQNQQGAATNVPGYMTPTDRYHPQQSGLNTLQIAQQLHSSPGTAANNVSYMSGVPQQFAQAPPPSGSLPSRPNALALGIARQNQAALEARARYAQEQHAAALAHRANPAYPQQQPQHAQHYQHQQHPHQHSSHPSTVAALLGNPGYYSVQPGTFAQQPRQQPQQPPPPPPQQQQQRSYQTHTAAGNTSSGKKADPPHPPGRRANTQSTTKSKPPSLRRDSSDKARVPPAVAGSAVTSAKVEQKPVTRTFPQTNTKSHTRVSSHEAKESTAPANLDIKQQAAATRSPASSVATAPKTTNPAQTRQSNPVATKPPSNPPATATAVRTKNEPVQVPATKKVTAAQTTPAAPAVAIAPSKASASQPTPKKAAVAPGSQHAVLKLVEPLRPALLNDHDALQIKQGSFAKVVESTTDPEKMKVAFQYLLSYSSAIPIPKNLVANIVKDCTSAVILKNQNTNIPQDVVASVIVVWLWANHERAFQAAFNKSGRIDVDSHCKWLIHTCAGLAVRNLANDAAKEPTATDDLWTRLATARKLLSAYKQGGGLGVPAETDLPVLQMRLEMQVAAVVSKALTKSLSVSETSDQALPKFQSLVSYLDELQLAALQAKAQERSLLANLISRRASMTESFSHAYVSSMVRAGEAIGHGKLFEAVQNEESSTCTMIPYDVFTEETNEWEDPCKPLEGMTLGLTAEALTRRAHARAMIQKSLRKLQDKNNIKGGTLSAGPYADPNSNIGKPGKNQPASSPRTGAKRKNSISEKVPPGTGSVRAPNWNVYNPRHFTEAVEWSSTELENSPYGRHSVSDRPRSLSLSLTARTDAKRLKKDQKLTELESKPSYEEDGVKRSTLEIPWSDVADIFQRVELPKKSASRSASHSHETTPLPVDGKIFAPFCMPTGALPENDTDEDDDGSEEDISDGAVLSRHQVVLDRMKQRMEEYNEARRVQQELRKSRKH